MLDIEIIKAVKDSKHSKVKLAVVDIDGILRGKIIHRDKFLEIANSTIGFCDVVFGWDASDKCYDNVEVTGWKTAYPDASAKLDLSTFRQIPWDNDVPFFLADFEQDEKLALAACPRSLLKRIQRQSAEMGFVPVFSQEFEWFNFLGTPNDLGLKDFSELKPISPGMFGYSLLRPSQHQAYFNDLFSMLEQFNIQLEGIHTETGPGVYEAAIRYDEVLAAADKAVLFKNSVKEIAYQHQIVASFMAKWNDDLPGCGGHIHQSLWNVNRTENLFYSDAKENGMSELMENYLAGQLYCLPHIMPMFVPNVNSYKRLTEGAWAPTTISWGFDNRTTAIRAVGQSKQSKRLEMRLPGSDTNAYLAIAASLAAGLYGIKNKLKLESPATVGNAYANETLEKLPSDLWTATQNMKQSNVAKELFGEAFVAHFCGTREWEWREFSKAVTNWELKRYFEII